MGGPAEFHGYRILEHVEVEGGERTEG